MELPSGTRPYSTFPPVPSVLPVPSRPVGPSPFRPPRTIREVCGAHAPASADLPDTVRRRWGCGPRAAGAADRRGGRRGRDLRAGRRCDRVRRRASRGVPARPGGGHLCVRRDRPLDVGAAGRTGDRRRGRGRGRPGRRRRRAGRRSGAPRAQAPARAPPLPHTQARPEAHRAALPPAPVPLGALSGAVRLGAVLVLAALLLALASGGAAERARTAGRGAGWPRAARAGPRRRR